MNTPDDTQQRLEALEIKASFTEDALDKLDQIIIRQQQTLDALVTQLRELRTQVASTSDSTHSSAARDELPPHY